MDDLRQRFATLDRVPAPDVWGDVERRLELLTQTAFPRPVVSIKPGGQRAPRVSTSGAAKTLGYRRTGWLILAAALMATLLIGGALAVGSGIARFSASLPPSPHASQLISPPPASPLGGSGSWTPTGGMVETRFGATATLLPDGKVLVAGGNAQFNRRGPSSATAELYDPSTGRWTLTGSMRAARQDHAAVLLPNGEVLVVGGGGSRRLASAELYDPISGAWSAAGRMTIARANPTATLMADGKVLVSGGNSAQAAGPEPSAELYDRTTGTWAGTAAMSVAREGHTATLLSDGRVLVAGGGCCSQAARASTELYDPASGRWTRTGSLGSARLYHTAILLADGRVLVYGGDNRGDQFAVTTAELYDPVTGTWVATARPHSQGNLFEAGQPARLSDGRVLAIGGGVGEVYDPSSGTWSTVGGPIGGLPTVHASVLLVDGRVLVTYDQGAVLFDADGTH